MFSFISAAFLNTFANLLADTPACLHIPSTNEEFERRDPTRGAKKRPMFRWAHSIMLKQWWWFVRVQTYLGVFPPHIRAGVYLPTYYTYYLMLTGLLTNRCQDWKYFDKFGRWVLSDKLRPDSLCQRLTRLQIGRYFGSQTAFVWSKI